MKTISKPEQFENKEHFGVIIFPAKETGAIEYVSFTNQAELEAWASKELSKKSNQRNFRILSAKPLSLTVEVAETVKARLSQS